MTELTSNTIGEALTIDQQNADRAFNLWLDDSDKTIPFVMSGFAGSGKTYLSIRFLKLVEEKDLCWTVVAPTHKAVGVIREALNVKELQATWYPSTIHRLLRLKLKRTGDLEVCEETEQTAKSLEQLELVLVDEASMVDSKLLEIIFQCAHTFGTRLVFVGDPAQLPPVGETTSPVFSLKRAVKAHLKEVVRHQGPVLHLANCFRNGSLSCVPPPPFPSIKTKQGLVGALDQQSWLLRAQSALKSASLSENPDGVRILCYTNRNLENLVPIARRAIHGDMADQMSVLPGEVLITRSAVMAAASLTGDEICEEPDLVLGSNRELIVQDVIPNRCDLGAWGMKKQSGFDPPIIETLVAKVSAGELELSLRLLPPAGSSPRKLLDNALNNLRNQARELGKNGGRSLWRQFFLIRDAFASLGPASVLTIHRSQGSTFDEVFVAADVFWPSNLILRKQLVYVAVTRARHEVWLAGTKTSNSSKAQWEENFITSFKSK